MQKKWTILVIAPIAALVGVMFYVYNQSDFTTLDGEQHKHSDLRGQYVLVNYFAEWCAPCLKEVPELSELQRIKPDNVLLFAISYDDVTDDKLRELQIKYEMEFPLINTISEPFPFERPQFLPATYVLKPDGTVAGQLFGEQTAESLLNVIAEIEGGS
ncbi:TlpA family protein disulfide reductase [Glaciecola sp. XM2]|jgi:thiol-disulfide isomerase/thioredoxin|uniref:TlpA family protein disulfide reductase n=1 Tax=Glaciecola sp. XM2 TaxID=1914931 RepID=UPI001BDDF1EF|nr:TlpA disulfide reductase family protein [Glaciecola sp. XM2]MBT1449588.1 TlpA family protein disulfide reductase [Glaciecola sp. XM2]